LLDKVIKLPDQFLPFVETAPPWLKVWIYALIVLNFATIAAVTVSYLISKQKLTQQQSLESFTLDKPGNADEIPLGDGRSWALTGRFPIVEYDMAHPPITVDVYKQPDHDPVQHGEVRPDNVLGVWRFEPLKFPGDGSFEILVVATLGGRRTEHLIQVKCLTKATAYQNIINRNRESSGAGQLTPRTRENVSLPDLKRQLFDLQNRLYEQYFLKQHPTQHDLSASSETVFEALNLLDPVLPLFPNDFDLQNFRAYFLKDYAEILIEQKRTVEAHRVLDESGKMFEAIHQQNPQDPAAWNGLGSVAAIRGDYHSALFNIEGALRIAPDYAEALHDRELVLRKLSDEQITSRGQPLTH
jgi:hypothetical protein